ncbi:unnamed protein product [Lactuca saligna]|uniref:Acyl-coenzyme A thioesterase 13 n=1 Tax=Lactuca saligna TaxID=75948 RepID=A0AA36EMC5_LACSI|nr:unnamed protein product [Lactuca saligna]
MGEVIWIPHLRRALAVGILSSFALHIKQVIFSGISCIHFNVVSSLGRLISLTNSGVLGADFHSQLMIPFWRRSLILQCLLRSNLYASGKDVFRVESPIHLSSQNMVSSPDPIFFTIISSMSISNNFNSSCIPTIRFQIPEGEIESSMEMEKRPIEYLLVTQQDSDRIARFNLPRPQAADCFYTQFNIRGIRVDRFQPDSLTCSFTVPPRLTDRNGNLAVGAIASLVDVIGSTLVHAKDVSFNVSTDMSISYLSTAKFNDELEIRGKLLGRKEGYCGTLIVLKKKATGEIIAEGRHSLFCKPISKI